MTEQAQRLAEITAIAKKADWAKGDGLLPVIIQHDVTGQILMLGYMNDAALMHTGESGKVTFFSRSKQRLWTKGESSSNFLNLVNASIDCDNDTILITAIPDGPTCHTGSFSCFGDEDPANSAFLDQLSGIIAARHSAMPKDSYTTSLFAAGKARIAQKVGEEGVELALARMKDDKEEMANEAADLLFHMMVLLQDAGLGLGDAIAILKARHAKA